MSQLPIRVLVAKPGHDRGAKVVARGLRDAGMEVIYTGLHRSPVQIAEAALQEDVQVVGLSVLSGAHGTLVPKVVTALAERGLDDVLVVVGGIIPDVDVDPLTGDGVAKVFGPGSKVEEIVQYIEANAPSR
jgi:methylmalonyl-CoA mutase C-terminal domain/subunit